MGKVGYRAGVNHSVSPKGLSKEGASVGSLARFGFGKHISDVHAYIINHYSLDVKSLWVEYYMPTFSREIDPNPRLTYVQFHEASRWNIRYSLSISSSGRLLAGVKG